MHHEHVVEEKHFSLVLSGFLSAADVRHFVESTVADKAAMQQSQLLTYNITNVSLPLNGYMTIISA